ncbi:SO_0444 family Cu/Zn efflux transporter [Desulfomicrobium escambiense]|uniref:SO_0444 family Cu/Zn efflux transporter n=1 Tax=Desulfomicrobium escambiense TaxID=29503 RepID=UPI000412CD6E|nr:SO_0444 family Cu/Zn efflux transporter [Desulfomicrobium escambiense]
MSGFLKVCWDILVDSSVWMLFGFFMAGLLRAFVPADIVARHLGRGRSGNVFKAALFGVPLPLCSCGVIPAAAGLRRMGASKGATASFLISTPETGVDSMSVSWALLDPLMTVLRPLSAFVTAMAAGLFIDAADKGDEPGKAPAESDLPQAPACSSGCCSCSGATKPTPAGIVVPSGAPGPEPGDPFAAPGNGGAKHVATVSSWRRFLDGQRFAFDDLMGDIAPWFGLGIVLAGLITLYLPENLGAMLPGGGAMLAMLLISMPMYVCATASTPIAAALALKGFSPGALLVFLLAGPATNAATVLMVGKLLGRRSAVIYVTTIAVVTMACAVAADAVYAALGFHIHSWLGGSGAEEGGPLSVAAALLMLAILVRAVARLAVRRFGPRTN